VPIPRSEVIVVRFSPKTLARIEQAQAVMGFTSTGRFVAWCADQLAGAILQAAQQIGAGEGDGASCSTWLEYRIQLREDAR
jgi:hypothetical protein